MRKFDSVLEKANQTIYNPAGLNFLPPRKCAYLFVSRISLSVYTRMRTDGVCFLRSSRLSTIESVSSVQSSHLRFLSSVLFSALVPSLHFCHFSEVVVSLLVVIIFSKIVPPVLTKLIQVIRNPEFVFSLSCIDCD